MSQKSAGKPVDLDALNPIPMDHRHMSPLNYSMVFWSSTIIVQIMVIGLYLMPPAGVLNFQQTLVVGLISGTICATFIMLNGDAGIRYGVPFVIQGRSGFGTKGARIVAFIRSIPAICWNGIGTWIGALSMREVTMQLFGIGDVWVYFFMLLVLQSILAYKGVRSIKWFDSAMSIVIFAMLAYFFYVVFATGKVDFSIAISFKGSWSLPFIAGIMAATANYTTIMLNASDIIRHIKPKNETSMMRSNAFANYFGIVPPWMFMFISGIIIALATGASDPIKGLVQLSPHPVFGIILLLFIILAQITSNLSLNILPPALAFQDIFKIGWKTGVITVAVLSIGVCPWVLFTSDYFFLFQNIYSCFLGPALGVMIADYFIIRKKKLNLKVLYDDNGIYTYKGGFSIAGMVSLVAGAVMSFMFLSYSWLVGFPFTIILYTIIKRSGLEKEFEQREKEIENA